MPGQNARTPPPKRWKRSFDMAHPSALARKENGATHDQPLSLVSYSFDWATFRAMMIEAGFFCRLLKTILKTAPLTTTRPNVSVNPILFAPRWHLLPMDRALCLTLIHYQPAQRCLKEETKQGLSTWSVESCVLGHLISYSLSILFRLAGLIRHHLANDSGIRSTSSERYINGGHHTIKTSTPEHRSPTSNGNDLEPMDYRCYSQTKLQHQIEVTKMNYRLLIRNRVIEMNEF